jgi:hypothetical protein
MMLNFFNKKKNVESGVVSVVSIDDEEDDSIMFFCFIFKSLG